MPEPNGFDGYFTSVLGHEVYAIKSLNKMSRPIILLHGAVASRRYMIPTAKLLSETFEVYVPEMPGHGRSSKPRAALDVLEQARVMNEWMHANGIENAALLANSYGCQIAVEMVCKEPKLFRALILTDPTGDPVVKKPTDYLWKLILDGFVEPPLAPLMMWFDIYDMGIPRIIQTTLHMFHHKVKERLPLIPIKTEVVRGAKDPICSEQWCHEIVRLIPDARFDVIPDAPHSVNSATAPQLCKIVNDFLPLTTTAGSIA